MPQVAPAILPQIYNIFINPELFQPKLRLMATEIFSAIVDVVAEMSDYDKTAAKKYLIPYLPNFMSAMINSFSMPDDPKYMDCNLRREILKVYMVLF